MLKPLLSAVIISGALISCSLDENDGADKKVIIQEMMKKQYQSEIEFKEASTAGYLFYTKCDTGDLIVYDHSTKRFSLFGKSNQPCVKHDEKTTNKKVINKNNQSMKQSEEKQKAKISGGHD